MTGGSTHLERSLTGKPPVVFILHDLLGSTLVLQPGARYTAVAVFDTEYHYARYQTFLLRRMPGTKELSVAQRSQHKPVTHRWWFRAVLLTLFMLPAIAKVPYDPAHTTAVIQAVLAEPFVVVLPELLPVAKLLLFAVAALPLLGVLQSGRVVLANYATMLAVVSLLQHMADTESWGFVWLLIPMLLALLMPYTVQEGSAVPALHTEFLNEAGVTYCMITPVILGTLLMFPDAFDRRTLSEMSFVGLIFGLINVVVWFGLAPHSWWMGVLHLPLVIIATFALAEARLHKQQPATVVSE